MIQKYATKNNFTAAVKKLEDRLKLADSIHRDAGFRLRAQFKQQDNALDQWASDKANDGYATRETREQLAKGLKPLTALNEIGEHAIKDIEGELSGAHLPQVLGGYASFGAGGGLAGALIAGKGRRLAGAGVGSILGLVANYLRRKSYYGNLIQY
jgi:hypothetical protein